MAAVYKQESKLSPFEVCIKPFQSKLSLLFGFDQECLSKSGESPKTVKKLIHNSFNDNYQQFLASITVKALCPNKNKVISGFALNKGSTKVNSWEKIMTLFGKTGI